MAIIQSDIIIAYKKFNDMVLSLKDPKDDPVKFNKVRELAKHIQHPICMYHAVREMEEEAKELKVRAEKNEEELKKVKDAIDYLKAKYNI